ncbi:26S proteasome non-ATPase regulatory subunit 2 [Galemys pyrenaicus]|uniref:26S proteasome non-ATPase regulatory subunit 2 n=1 Tax=Galemys pyrenaicus TaxID=202257 RepID=A0A8J6DPM2_GALPY|nr:26S proteasome non-ATPase regulatory subunit 2 [Galemys pyrenaicus]
MGFVVSSGFRGGPEAGDSRLAEEGGSPAVSGRRPALQEAVRPACAREAIWETGRGERCARSLPAVAADMEEGGRDKAPVQPQQPPASVPGGGDEKSSGKERREPGDKDKEQELSEEDKQLQDELEMLVERLGEKDTSLYRPALEELRRQIRSSTTSMTSVPKPLKFLRPHYGKLKEIYENMAPGENKRFAADIISVLAMTMSGERECLKYRLVGSQEELASWGHEYVRHLAGEVAKEWQELDDAEKTQREPLLTLVKEIVPYNMAHNAEHEACDLLMEIEQVDMLEKDIDENAYAKVCLYLTSCVNYVPEPENSALLRCALGVFRKFSRFPEALRLALMLNDMELVEDIFTSCKDVYVGDELAEEGISSWMGCLPEELGFVVSGLELRACSVPSANGGLADVMALSHRVVQKQMAFMLGRHGVFLELSEDVEEYEDLTEIMSNVQLNSNFLALARELDIMEPKVPDDIYKTHLENNRFGGSGSQVDSARMNLASSFVNGFVNAAFGQDKLLTDDGNKWLYKNKDHGMLSAAASLGMILLWDVDGGLTQIDKYLYSSEDYIKSGALLACGIVNSGVRNECDPALALLSDYVLHNSNTMRLGSIFGLGLAYAGSNREDVLTLLLPVMGDSKSSMEVAGVTALACGMIAVGSCNGDVTSTILQTIMEKSETELKDTYARWLPLGLGLNHLGKGEAIEAILAALEVVSEPFRSFANTLVDVCAYAGSGNVLKVQQLLHICSEHFDSKEKEEDKDKKEKKDKDKKEAPADMGAHQGVAVLGIALIAMGEEIGAEMALRTFGHLLRYGEPTLRRAVPLALALISVSNPRLNILDTLSKFSHDADPEVSYNSIFAMGMVGSGTNNARLAAMLRQLAQYHAKDPNNLFMVRLAQGLTHLGKGTLTLCPYHSDRQLMSQVAVAGLLTVLVSFLDVRNIILGKSHYVLYGLVAAMQPRMLVTFDEELRPLPVSVRVGQAVDVVGQAGKPKTITGFQTHTTPVLLAHGERAELATEEFLPVTPILEGFVILRKNPNYDL